ncbi:MAG: DUF3108 domain-containing protein [Gammaproteobacteria bacterium]|nr:DUF3108 domain-containing protein [Gammaproteobacteria bacterium]
MDRRGFLQQLLAIGLIILTPPLQASPGTELESFTARFQVKRNGLPLGNLDLRLVINEGQYHYTGHTRPGAIIRWFMADEVHESSKGTYADRQVIPLSYEFRQGNGKVKKQTLLDFDWQAKKVWTDSEGARWSQAIAVGTHDKFSQQLALRLSLSEGVKAVSYPVADGGRVKNYHYQVAGNETINLPYGRLKCLKVKRNKDNHPPDYRIWFAPELDYLPVKIERKRKSGRYSIELLEFNGRSNPAAEAHD